MTLARGLCATLVVAAAMELMGCASLKAVFSDHPMSEQPVVAAPAPDVAASAAAAAAGNERADYRLEIEAPDPLRALLLDYLDLSRFQNAPATDSINAAELERLIRAVPAQARALLETEGYFNAQVTVQHAVSHTPMPLLRVMVDPGPRTRVANYSVEVTGELQKAAAAGEANAVREMAALRHQWPLHTGDAFRDVAWANAKNQTIARIRADGYASAVWSSTNARVDAPGNQVDVAVVIDSGPLYHLGEIHIEGLSRYAEDSVRKLSTFGPGQPYNEKTLLDFQERLQKVGLFEGASVTIDADPKTAGAAPVIIRVKEMPLQQATVGLGYSANTGPRVTLEHTHRDVFGTHWIAANKFELGPDQQTWSGELTSHPLDDLYRDLIAGSSSRLKADDQVLLSTSARIGRAQDTPRIGRLYYAEFIHTRLDSDLLTNQADAVSLNYNWIYRDIDNVLLPTQGYTASLQGGVGVAHGTQTLLGEPQQESRGPFTRLYGRLTLYQPLGSSWFGTARVEAGQVFTHDEVGVPDTVLFRAGGDDSVRGYGYRTLGPTVGGVTVSGRTLATASVEVARPISPKYPAFWWATFADAGNAADRWSNYRADVGYGVGLRWRSPVGPLRFDVAYGEQVKQLRLYFSVGIAF